MSVRKQKVTESPVKLHTCGECSGGEYIDVVRSRTADGKPFLKKCVFAT